jgi:hypothetical protein
MRQNEHVRLADERQRQAAVLAAASEGYGTRSVQYPEFLRKCALEILPLLRRNKERACKTDTLEEECQLFVLH